MIKVNLTPLDELENPYWWIPDVACIIAVVVFGYLFIQFQVAELQTQYAQVIDETRSYKSNYEKIKDDAERLKELEQQIDELNNKLSSLKDITVTKISRFRPVIVMEHFQNLKPEGAWLTDLEIRKDSTFVIAGAAFDNILVSEYFTELKATKNQQVRSADLRTQVFFTDVALEVSSVIETADGAFPELTNFPRFILKGRFSEVPTVEPVSIASALNTNPPR